MNFNDIVNQVTNEIISKTDENIDNNEAKNNENNENVTQIKPQIDLEVIDIDKRGNYLNWENNWLISDKEILQELNKKGYTLFIDEKGNLSYLDLENKPVKVEKPNIKFSSELGKSVSFFKQNEESIKPYDLISIIGKEFNTRVNKVFIKRNGKYLLNLFRPTKYMNITSYSNEPTTILKLIKHLVNYDDEKYNYFLNWLAYFFQTFQKPQTAIVLKGLQGAGKGILFDLIISKLFGEEQVSTIDDKALNSNFLLSLFANKLFIVFEETGQGEVKSNKKIKNLIKQIITNKTITLEEKNKVRKKVNLYGACLFFTNEGKFLEIEPNDRRFSVFLTGDPLHWESINFLGFGSYNKLKEAILSELDDFAGYLYTYPVNPNIANKPLETPEKQAVINATSTRYREFYEAIKRKDIEFFTPLLELDDINANVLYKELQENFKKGIIKRSELVKVFNYMYDSNLTSHQLKKELAVIDPYFYENVKTIKGNKYIILF
ncbi:hypothetical protein FE773_00820 [Caminibacter mediatlanticus TB-2]|uniref:NrS-1 polymerase-like helicase domain-containing protein n=1 Tax=Caminibacter mediatlanticus TB-2 TaxID=391592 RepID=A0ABX5V710_9BACT|nr:DUF5906 domain-containing protein [Caminibacter mediatlanticus]QCT93769.1 hypothetical protein FE773_00820 [Caminibacter mediatlanticus TB-2]